MVTISSYVAMRFHQRVMSDWSDTRVVAGKEHDSILGEGWRCAIRFHRRSAHDHERLIRAKREQRLDFSGACAADAPRLLQHAGAPASTRVVPFDDVIVTPRREK